MQLKTFLKKGILVAIAAITLGSETFAQGGSLLPYVPPPPGVSKINLVQQLPNQSWQTLIGSVINMILAVAGSLAFVSFTVGGIMMISAQGAEDKIKKGKSIILWSLIALVVIGASYGVVYGITQLKFFQ